MVAGTTLTATVAVTVAPSRSVIDAVSVWAPTLSPGTVSVAPVPRLPSRLDDQRMAADRSPSSASLAAPPRRKGLPVTNALPVAGPRIVIVGGTFGARTTNDRCALPATPAELVTDALTVCVPTESRVVEKAAPLPMTPSRSETQRRLPARLPSTASVAVAEKVTLSPANTVAPLAGAPIATVGGVGVTVIVTDAEPVTPSESRTEAVSTWVPSERWAALTLPPVPRAPSRLDDQASCPVSVPSKSSSAVPVRATGVATATDVPLVGAVIRTWGAAFGLRTRTVICAEPVRPSLSVALAVITCVPTESLLTLSAAPLPRLPSRSELHWRRLARLPSSTSLAIPTKLIASPRKATAPAAGAVIVTVGALPVNRRTSFGAAPPSRDWYVASSAEEFLRAKL